MGFFGGAGVDRRQLPAVGSSARAGDGGEFIAPDTILFNTENSVTALYPDAGFESGNAWRVVDAPVGISFGEAPFNLPQNGNVL